MIPTYISLTSIFDNQSELLKTLNSIKNQLELPSKCFIFLSEEGYLLDKGFKNREITNLKLKNFIQTNEKLFEVRWVKNIGPYRKLLPLLKEKWEEDCLIITIDDDTEYNNNLIYNMKNDYNLYKCVINYRGFTLKKTNGLFTYESRDSMKKLNLHNFCTGKGGVLYHPSFFYKTEDIIFNEDLFTNYCKTTDDIWFYFIRLCNNINCYIDTKPYMISDNSTKYGLFQNFNSKKQLNTINMIKTIKLLQELNYNI
jgi:hypothetical protein